MTIADPGLLYVGAFVATIVTAIYVFYQYRFSYWKKLGVTYPEPSIPFGNIREFILGKRPAAHIYTELYQQYHDEHKAIGIFQLFNPTLMLLDLDLIKHVMVKDAASFPDRGSYQDEKHDPLTANLIGIGGAKWKALRVKLTPTFTSGKMKMMFSTLLECADELDKCIRESLSQDNTIEIQDILARFTTDVIALCAFGIQCNCLKDPNAEFRQKGRQFFDRGLLGKLGLILKFMAPPVAKLTGLGTTPKEITEFFMNAVKETVEFREKNNITRNDFMQMMIELKNKGFIDGDKQSASEHYLIDIKVVAAQAFSFYLAGFETSSTTVTFCLYELAQNEEVQSRLREEINTVLAKHGGKVSYEAIEEMEYLTMVLAETLRKHPPVVSLTRDCAKAQTLPGTKLRVERGVQVMIPVFALHHDPELYPEPELFDPERFSKSAKEVRNHYAYLPFGTGPRVCIGQRFGLMQSNVALLYIIRAFDVTLSDKTQVPLVLDPAAFVLSPKGGMPLCFTPRKA